MAIVSLNVTTPLITGFRYLVYASLSPRFQTTDISQGKLRLRVRLDSLA